MVPTSQAHSSADIHRAAEIVAEAHGCHVSIQTTTPLRVGEWPYVPWTIAELEIIVGVLTRYAQAAGRMESARRALGGAEITRSRNKSAKTRQNWHWIILSDYTLEQHGLRKKWGPQIALAHELAHYWDHRTGHLLSRLLLRPGVIVRGLPEAVGDELGPTWWGRMSPVEQWAETVAMYLYPEYQSILEQENDSRECFSVCYAPGDEHRLPSLGPKHLDYVESWFASLRQAS